MNHRTVPAPRNVQIPRASIPVHTEEPEPMQINTYHLSAEERERRIFHHLCLYCGEAGHFRIACPSRPRPTATRPVSLNVDALNPNLCVSVPVVITANGRHITTSALVDSGAGGNFISADFARQHNITLIRCPSSLTVEAIDGRSLGSGQVSHITQQLHLQLHSEIIQFYVFHTPHTPVILGLPWLRKHDPQISPRLLHHPSE